MHREKTFSDDAVQAIREGATTEVLKVRGKEYTTRKVFRPEKDPLIDSLTIGTLQGVVDYIGMKETPGHNTFVIVRNARTVEVVTNVESKTARRATLLTAKVPKFDFQYGQYYSHEEFITNLLRNFEDEATEEVDGELKLVNPIKNGKSGMFKMIRSLDVSTSVKTEDDGVSQKAIVKAGIEKAEETINNPYQLTPINCFPEVSVAGEFVLRLRQTGYEVGIALYQQNPYAWESEVVQQVAGWLNNNLEDVTVLG